MNFTQAMKVLVANGVVSLNGVSYELDVDGFGLINAATGDALPFTAELLDSVSFVKVNNIPALAADEVYAVFNEDKGRWISTTEVARHKTEGRRVAIFHLDRLI